MKNIKKRNNFVKILGKERILGNKSYNLPPAENENEKWKREKNFWKIILQKSFFLIFSGRVEQWKNEV